MNDEKNAKSTTDLLQASHEQASAPSLSTAQAPSAERATTPAITPRRQFMLRLASNAQRIAPKRSLWQRSVSWFIRTTFAPSWLPKSLQHPSFGYLVALLLQVLAIVLTVYLDSQLHVLIFTGLLEILAVALVALSWGVGPSIFATLFGACLFEYVVAPPQFNWDLTDPKAIVQLLLFVLIGCVISIVASRTERARRQAESLAVSLTKEHARLEAIIETVPDIVSIYDKRGQLTQTNEVGRQSELFDTESPLSLLEERAAKQEAFTLTGQLVALDHLPVPRALRGETVEGQEIRFLTPAGNERFLSLSAAPLRTAQGKIDGVVSVMRDLSSLHQAEREAANQAIELEALLQSLADGLYVVDPGGTIIRSNRAFQAITAATGENSARLAGLSRDERHALFHVRTEEDQLLSPEAWPETRILKGEVLQGPSAVDLRLRNLDGHELQVSVSGAPLYNREGELIAALCICHDVTERRKLEQRTQEALDALLAMAEVLVTHGDEEVRSTTGTLKDSALRMAELTSRVLACQRVSIFLVDAATSTLRPSAAVGFSLPSEAGWWASLTQVEIPLSTPSISSLIARLQAGEVIVQDMWAGPFSTCAHNYPAHNALIAPINIGQQLIGVLFLSQEEPEHLYTQEERALTGAVAHLLALVFEREHLLREQAESQATELALRAANQHMEEFLGMISHELRTPLTSIKGNTQLAVRQLRSSLQNFERIFGLYDAAEQQTNRLNRLVNDLLDVSRAQAGYLELIPLRCDLRDLVHEAFQEQGKMWPARILNLEMDDALPLPLDADADRIMQVITNYLTNALKYSGSEQPIFVSARREGSDAYFAVRDKGPGLSTGQQQHIWERFQRVPEIEVLSAAHSSQTGLGLGLYISRTIIEGHDGSAGVQSQPGQGSTFWFRLPLAEELASEKPK